MLHSFNGVIIPSTKVCTLQSPFVFLFLMILIYTSLKISGPGVSLTLCCFVVYSTKRFV